MIAIDPGPTKSGVVMMKASKIEFAGILPNAAALIFLRANTDQSLAIEMIASYGMAVGAEVFETCVWIGRFVEAHRGQRRFVKRQEVKMHLCRDSRANDSTIRKALIDRLGVQGTKKNPGPLFGIKADLFAALGVALTALETRGTWTSGNQ